MWNAMVRVLRMTVMTVERVSGVKIERTIVSGMRRSERETRMRRGVGRPLPLELMTEGYGGVKRKERLGSGTDSSSWVFKDEV